MGKKRKEPVIVMVMFLLVEVGLFALLVFKWMHRGVEEAQGGMKTEQLYLVMGVLVVLYFFYVQLRANKLQLRVIGEKVKTQTVLEALPQGFMVIDDDGMIVSSNAAACRALAADPVLILGQAVSAYFDDEFVTRLKGNFSGVVEARSREGRRPLRVEVRVLPGEAGRLLCLETVREAEPAPAAPVADAGPDWADRVWQTLSAPATRTDLPAEVRTAISEALLNAGRSRCASMGDAVPGSPDRKRMRIADVAAPALERAAAVAAARGITLNRDVDAAAEASVDGRWLERTLDELMLNALSFTKAGGEITVTIRAEGTDAMMVVRDNGIGISGEDLPRVTDAGYRGSKQTPASQGGRGQGLAVARKVAEAHGGSLRVESREGTGTRVTVSLPVS